MNWDVTIPDTLRQTKAPSYNSYRDAASSQKGWVAALVEERKVAKVLQLSLHFMPVAIETLGVISN